MNIKPGQGSGHPTPEQVTPEQVRENLDKTEKTLRDRLEVLSLRSAEIQARMDRIESDQANVMPTNALSQVAGLLLLLAGDTLDRIEEEKNLANFHLSKLQAGRAQLDAVTGKGKPMIQVATSMPGPGAGFRITGPGMGKEPA